MTLAVEQMTIAITAASALIIIAVMLIFAAMRGVRNVLNYVKKNPDASYDFFLQDPQKWQVFIGDSPDAITMHQHRAQGRRKQNPVGPIRFDVPKLNNRIVTVFAMEKDSFDALSRFVSGTPSKEDIQREEARRNATIGEAPPNCTYEERIKYYSLADLESIRERIDKGQFPDRHQLVIEEIERRKKK